MAAITLTSQRFPVGATVNAYPVTNWLTNQRPPSGAPVGASSGSGVVAADGSVTIAGLADQTSYFAYALVGGEDRYVRFSTPAAAAQAGVLDYIPQPAHHGLHGWTMDGALVGTSFNPTAGQLHVAKIYLPSTVTLTTLHAFVAAAGVTLTAGQNFGGIYSAAGVLLGKTADQSAAWTTTGTKSMALTAEAGQSLTIAGGDDVFVYAALLANGTTTPSWGAGNPNTSLANVNLAAAASRFGNILSGQTALPASIVPANIVAHRPMWAGVS